MLNFFRRYQRFFFIVITVVIVISFSFFGTYNTLLTRSSPHEEIVFKAIDGTAVTRGELEQMVLFLKSDSTDKLLFGGMWGPNFFNDGVIAKDFLTTGLGLVLVEHYKKELEPDLEARLDREKRYNYYVHPQAKFINAETIWSYFSPKIKENYQALRNSNDALSADAFAIRTNLFLAERQFPAPFLRQMLRYQEKQYNWVAPDENLERIDLSLFGYHTLEDWFGPRFMRLVCELIINAAKMAEEKGYSVSKEEVFVDLLNNAEKSFKENQNSPYLGVSSSKEYFDEQLRRLMLDKGQAVKIWSQVLLFRRYFHDVGNAIFLSPFEYQKVDYYAREDVEGELYKLPKELQFAQPRDVQKFEVYLDNTFVRHSLLALPTHPLPIAEVEQKTPELVQKRYLLDIAEYDKRNLQGKVSLKETWEWELDGNHWELLKAEFPFLGIKKGSTEEERLAALDSLDVAMREKVDLFARNSIVDLHPEWLKKALEQAKTKRVEVGIRLKGPSSQFAGLKQPEELLALLDSSTPGAAEKLALFTADGQTYYRIEKVDSSPTKEILTFGEANSAGIADRLLTSRLEAYYRSLQKEGKEGVAEFKKVDGSWREFADVQEAVAKSYFEPLLQAISEESDGENGEQKGHNFYATHRLYGYVKEIREKLAKGAEPAQFCRHLSAEESSETNKLPPRKTLTDQWLLDCDSYRLARSDVANSSLIDAKEAFALAIGSWSSVKISPQGEAGFFQLKERKNGSTQSTVALGVDKIQQLISDEAQRHLLQKALKVIEEKKAISLKYLDVESEG